MWIFIPPRANTQTIREQATGRVLRTQELPATPAQLLLLETGQTISVLKSATDYRLLIDYPANHEKSVPLEFGFVTEVDAEARLRLLAHKLGALDLTSDNLSVVGETRLVEATGETEADPTFASDLEEPANASENGRLMHYPQSRRL
jgi:hypothetical protein